MAVHVIKKWEPVSKGIWWEEWRLYCCCNSISSHEV